MEKSSLVDQMEKYYVDADGKTIAEAVELGQTILQFFSDIYGSVDLASKQEDQAMLNKVCDFYISLVIENFTRETFDHNKSNVVAQIETYKAENSDVGNYMHQVLLGSYSQILDNPFFRDDMCNILLRAYIIEGVIRTCNAHVFCRSPEIHKPDEQHRHVLLTYSNLQGSYHSLAMIAFLCNANMEAYYKMNIQVELYANAFCSGMADFIARAASGY